MNAPPIQLPAVGGRRAEGWVRRCGGPCGAEPPVALPSCLHRSSMSLPAALPRLPWLRTDGGWDEVADDPVAHGDVGAANHAHGHNVCRGEGKGKGRVGGWRRA